MRNLKRALSLTLASVMLLGMMVVGSSAAGYPDVSEEENIEAIEVLQTVGVMEGDNNGNFNPDDYVTREQMAVIMSKLLNLDYNYYQGTNPFSDVPAWAAPYVAACAANGITSGIGGGMYGAGQNVNAVQAALMMLKALGYFQYQQDFGDDYVLATVKQATEIGLFAQIDSNAQAALTRNEVAQMALNALQADLVRFTGDPGVKYTGSNGESWIGGYKAEYTPRTSTDPKYNRLIDNKHSSNIDYSGQYYCQLGEELYNGDLVKRVDSDIFSRPSYTWTYKTEKIGTYIDREKLQATYTKGVSGRELYDLLNNITIRDYDLEVYVDGHKAGEAGGADRATYYTNNYKYASTKEEFTSADLKRSNTDSLGATGAGVLTEVYLDRDNEIITITSIHTWLAQATSAYSATRESASLKVFMVDETGRTKTANVADVPEAEGVTADSFYLVRMSDKDTTTLEIVDIEEPQILAESTVTKFSNGKDDKTENYPTKLTTDGVEYSKSNRAFYDADTLNQYDENLLTSNTYNVYLDKYGYFVGVDLFEGNKQYVFVTGYDMRNSNLSIKTASASGIFLDGTMDNITVNVKDTNKNIANMVTAKGDSNAQAYYQQWGTNASDGVFVLNRWYTYTEDNGVYTLKPCVNKDGEAMMLAAKSENNAVAASAAEMKLNCAKLRLDGVSNSDALLMGETMTYVNDKIYITNGTESPVSAATEPKFDLVSQRAYGEDDSVFITVDVDDVSGSFASGGKITRAITDVNGVYTGIQDVDIITTVANRVVGDYLVTPGGSKATNGSNAWAAGKPATHPKDNFIPASNDKTYLGENAYAVFDKNNFIIGAVILGEAEGNNATKAYIIDPVKYERYENGTYYWQFEAVIDGEIVTQEAQSKFQSTIDEMRNNRYEVVELRYNAAGDVVTDVKKINRTDSTATGLDKIWGNPYDEILTAPTGHQVKDKESIYDVVLTGTAAGTDAGGNPTTTTFKYVTRPRYNGMLPDAANNVVPGHTTAGKTFVDTNMGTLNLQGNTMYVLNDQDDYGIDFVKNGTKAVVIQPEGSTGDWDVESHAFGSVQDAIDALGDVDGDSTNGKQFKGIITAVLNSQGVAEWVVFYSDTEVETKTNTSDTTSKMPVRVKYKLVGTSDAEATEYGIVYVEKDAVDGLAHVPSPDVHSGKSVIPGYHALIDVKKIIWDKKADPMKVVIFEYEENGDGNPETPSAGSKTVRVAYSTDFTDDTTKASSQVGYQNVTLKLDAAGFADLTATNFTRIPDGFKLVTGANGTEFTKLVKSTDSDVIYVNVEERTDVTKVEILPAAATRATEAADIELEVKYDGDDDAVKAAAKTAKLQVRVTYGSTENKNLATRILDANATGLTWDAAGTTDGAKIKVTYKTVESEANVAVKLFATLTIAGASDVATASFDADKTSAKVFAGDTVTVVFTAKDVGEYTAEQLASATKSVGATGSTTLGTTGDDAPAYTMTHAGLAAATGDDDGKAVITVTFKVTAVGAATDTISIDIQK